MGSSRHLRRIDVTLISFRIGLFILLFSLTYGLDNNNNTGVSLVEPEVGDARACPFCVSGECDTRTQISGLPIIQLIASVIIGLVWAAIFIWLYASFYESGSDVVGGYGPSPSYGYGHSPTYHAPPAPVYGPPPTYGPPPKPTYGPPPKASYGPPPAPVYGQPSAPVYSAPITGYSAPTSSYQSQGGFSGVTAPGQLKPPSRRSSTSALSSSYGRALDLLESNVAKALNSTMF